MKNSQQTAIKRILLNTFFILIVSETWVVWQNAHAEDQQRELKYIVDALWLDKQMTTHSNNLKLIDVRNQDDYKISHLPGAINFPVELSFEGSRIVSIKKIRQLFRKLGIHNSDRLVLYDDGHIKDAAHVFWMLETYGHEQVAVLDGGLPAWQKAGYESTYEVVHYPPSRYIPTITASRLSTKMGALLSLNNPNVIIIDSRQQDEFEGRKSRAQRSGHIPKAISMTTDKLLDETSSLPKLKSLPELRSLFKDINKSSLVMSYCNRGKDSAMTYLIMRSLGYNTSVYDGGWLEWGNDMQLPIEQ